MQRDHLNVIGCGVSGLSCGVRLLEQGYAVTIIAQSIPPATTSNKAAAFWYPYRAYPESRVLGWSKRSLEVFLELSADDATGIFAREFREVFADEVPDPWWRSAVDGFRRLRGDELPRGYTDGWALGAVLIETGTYLEWLVRHFEKLGGTIRQKKLTDLGDVDGNLLINCTGLGSRDLCDDLSLFPIRGQVVRTENPGLDYAMADENGPLGLTYVIPRGDDCILGGTAEENVWDESVDPKTSEEIIARAIALEPRLAKAKILGAHVGLRPGRPEVRLELEHLRSGRSVIHNYGHGGAGFTLSWGCAEEVVALTRS